jgi:hypothetical protein
VEGGGEELKDIPDYKKEIIKEHGCRISSG